MSFIPSLHFRPAEEKLTSDFCNEVINFYYRNSALVSLLENKDVEEIESYATGNFSMRPFKRMFSSLRKQEGLMNNPNISDKEKSLRDKTNIQWDPVPLIPPKLNSAIAISTKQPIDIIVTCMDPLAEHKKAKDLEFLKNKKDIEQVMQPLYDSMNFGKADLGPTKHSSIPFTGLPLDLDIDDESQFMIFANIIYNLAPESALETILEQMKEIKKFSQLKLMETTDQYKFGVSCHQCIDDKNTELPNFEYVHPKQIRTDRSRLPDYSDNVFRVIDKEVTPMELFKYFPDEIPDENYLEKIVNGEGKGRDNQGYCNCNNRDNISVSDFNTFKMSLKHCEVKSVDYVMVSQKKNSKFKTVNEDESKPHEKLWAQNTYTFYWLQNTKWFFAIDRLGFAYRAPGIEVYSGFSTNIYKSQIKSAVELCVGENKKAQIADIKLQHTLIMTLPDGYMVNMKGLRKAVNSMKDLNDDQRKSALSDLVEKGKESNIWIYETDDFDGRPGQGQAQPPVTAIPGGLKNSIEGYFSVIDRANQKIGQYTNINDQLTGQTPSPDMLIGLQKLLVNASINGLNYVPEALLAQYKSMFNIWAYYIQESIKRGGAGKLAIEGMIGSRKVGIIERLREGVKVMPLHVMGIKLTLGQREEERAMFKQTILELRQRGVINSFDEWMVLNTPNPKDAKLLIAIKEEKFAKKQEAQQQAILANQQAIMKQQGDNMIQNTQAAVAGKGQLIQVQGQVDDQLQKSAAQLGMSAQQLEYIAKLKLQQDRGSDQRKKALETLGAKSSLENQQSFA